MRILSYENGNDNKKYGERDSLHYQWVLDRENEVEDAEDHSLLIFVTQIQNS